MKEKFTYKGLDFSKENITKEDKWFYSLADFPIPKVVKQYHTRTIVLGGKKYGVIKSKNPLPEQICWAKMRAIVAEADRQFYEKQK